MGLEGMCLEQGLKHVDTQQTHMSHKLSMTFKTIIYLKMNKIIVFFTLTYYICVYGKRSSFLVNIMCTLLPPYVVGSAPKYALMYSLENH